MRSSVLLLAVCLLPWAAQAHEGFLSPHLHHLHTHGHEHEEHHDHAAEKTGKALRETEHMHELERRFHATTGVRYTRYDSFGIQADLWETGLGVAYDATPWLQIFAEGRYAWFDGDLGKEDGWLPPRLGFEAHFPVAQHLEIGIGMTVQFPGTEPLGADEEWELCPELDIRYDRGDWYLAAATGVTWVLGDHHHHFGDDFHGAHAGESHAEHEDHEDEDHAEHDHDAEHHADAHGHEDHAGHDDHLIHSLIDQHGTTEIGWQVAAGVRVLDRRLTVEGRLAGNHVIEGQLPARDYFRAGARVIYQVNENVSLLLNASIPVSGPQRNEFQSDFAVRLSF